ncbi:ABC transporter permease [Nocardia sp. NRRL S-836]|uniref:ABC transporter permease n=1 Tax=Nocardia sp. NRRL S-836 TaxID=1519492 RepID=UPI0006ADEF39|nr:ABC transporter permease [Nocardia sp. NRRL S-836]KOV89080.1 membrane protein [Nocardia sp. NRRL S-836]
MTLLAVERIKLFSTRSPYWCSALAIVLGVGLTAIVAAASEGQVSLGVTQIGSSQLAIAVVLVMAAIAVTTEYRFNTIRATFLAVPGRTSALVAKATVVALIAGVLGEIIAFGSVGIAKLLSPSSDLAINTAAEWRHVAGVGLIYAIGAVIAVAVGVLVRQTAGAVAILLVWQMLAEGLIGIIPKAGVKIQAWLPFMNATHFLSMASASPEQGGSGVDFKLSEWGSLGYFAGIAVALLVVALVVAKRRDA